MTGSGIGTPLASYVWDGIGDLTAINRGNGANTTYAYDGDDRLSGITHGFTNSSADVAWTFSYDAGNGLLSRAATNDAYTSYGAAQSQSYLGSGLNQYAKVSTASYTYDGRGNLLSDGTRTFTYDVDNRLLSETAPTALTLAYDPTGRLQTSTAGSATTTFLYDGNSLAAEYNGSTVLRRYVPSGLGIDMPLIWYEGAVEAAPRWLHTDNQGSIVAYSDSSGDNDDIYGYDPWGLPDATNGWSGSRFRYTGQITIPQASLYYYKARVYDPNLGRFLQTDPVGYASDVNLYAYVRNSPVNAADPSGMAVYQSNYMLPNGVTATVSELDVTASSPQTFADPGVSASLAFGAGGSPGAQAAAPGSVSEVVVTAARRNPLRTVTIIPQPNLNMGLLESANSIPEVMDQHQGGCGVALNPMDAIGQQIADKGAAISNFGYKLDIIGIPLDETGIGEVIQIAGGFFGFVGDTTGLVGGGVRFAATNDPRRGAYAFINAALGKGSGVTGHVAELTGYVADKITSAIGCPQ